MPHFLKYYSENTFQTDQIKQLLYLKKEYLMGNQIKCCDITNKQEFQLRPLSSKQIAYSSQINQIHFLTEIVYAVEHLCQAFTEPTIESIFGNIDGIMDYFEQEEVQKENRAISCTIVQPKSYMNERCMFSNELNLNYRIESMIILTQKKYQITKNQIESLFVMKKIKLLTQFQNTLADNEYIAQVLQNLNSIPGMPDFTWILQQKSTVAEMAEHLKYNISRYINWLNHYMSLTDIVSLARVRPFYHFAKYHMCTSINSPTKFTYQSELFKNEMQLFKAGAFLISSSFLPIVELPIEEGQSQSDTARMKPLLGDADNDLDSLSKKIEWIVTLNANNCNKIETMNTIYILPTTVFQITQIEQNEVSSKVHLQELEMLPFEIVREESKCDKFNYVKINQQNLKNQLKSLQETVEGKLKEKYYEQKREVKSDTASNQEEAVDETDLFKLNKIYLSHFLNSHLQEQVQKTSQAIEEITEGIVEEQIVLEIESDKEESIIQVVEVEKKERQRNEQIIQTYIKDNQLQKLQDQIDSIDYFGYLTTLNLSQSYLTKMEHLQLFPNLTSLFLYSNLISKIEGLHNNKSLKILSLARNQIEQLENIDHLLHLRQLYVNKNKLGSDSIQYINKLPLNKLELFAISFKNDDAGQCVDRVKYKHLPKLKRVIINESDHLSRSTRRNLSKLYPSITFQFISW